MATLNEVMKDTADAIREKTGKSELIAPVDFASEIKGITSGGGSGGGGADLEGEYFLAKPNGRYWKFTFMPEEMSRLRLEDFESSQIEAMYNVYEIVRNAQNVCGAASSSDDPYLPEYQARLDDFYTIGARINAAFIAISRYRAGYDYNTQDFNEGFLRVWKECDIKSNPPIEVGGIVLPSPYNLVEIMKIAARFEGMEITDDEAIMLIEQQYMLIPATEEEYKYWRLEYED